MHRREFLASAALAAIVPASVQSGQIADLIEQHRTAWQAFEDFITPDCDEYGAEYHRLTEAEEAALDAVCAAPVHTLDDARTKAVYLDTFLKHGN